MLRKIVNALVILPLAIIFVVFAVANRQLVTLSFDPFDSERSDTGRDAAAVYRYHRRCDFRRYGGKHRDLVWPAPMAEGGQAA